MKKVVIILVILFPLFVFAQTFERDLYFGLQNDADVTKLQEFLTEQGIYSGPITGNFFSLTLKAVRGFQGREGITPVAGYFGPKTRVRANVFLSKPIAESQQQAIIETGTKTPQVTSPKTNTDVVNSLQEQIRLLQQQIALLQQQQTILQQQNQQLTQQTQTLQQQSQTLQQIQQQTAPSPPPPPEPPKDTTPPEFTSGPTPTIELDKETGYYKIVKVDATINEPGIVNWPLHLTTFQQARACTSWTDGRFEPHSIYRCEITAFDTIGNQTKKSFEFTTGYGALIPIRKNDGYKLVPYPHYPPTDPPTTYLPEANFTFSTTENILNSITITKLFFDLTKRGYTELSADSKIILYDVSENVNDSYYNLAARGVITKYELTIPSRKSEPKPGILPQFYTDEYILELPVSIKIDNQRKKNVAVTITNINATNARTDDQITLMLKSIEINNPNVTIAYPANSNRVWWYKY